MNFFEVQLIERDGTLALVSDSFELAVPEATAAKLATWEGNRDRLVFGVRPEDVTDVTIAEGTFPSETTFDAYVKVVEPIGADKDLTLAPDADAPEETEFTVRVDADSQAREGDVITLAVDMAKTHLFDEDGTNLTL